MSNFIKLLFARHRAAYFKVSWRHFVWPARVYALAHGAQAHGHKESEVLHDLLKMKIVHRHHHSQNPDDYEM